jgi:hypothetical protein
VIGTKLEKDGHKKAFKYLNIASWIVYPLILIITISTFAITYSDRLV